MAGLERSVELTHAVPLLGDLLGVDGLVGAGDQRSQRTVVGVGIDPVDALVLDSSDARAEAQAQHGEGGEVDFGIAVGVGVMLFNLELALVVKQAVEYEGRITCDPELSGLEHALLFKKLPRPPRKSGGLFQTTGLLKEELLQLRHLGVIEGAQPQITGDGLLMLGDRRLSFAVEFDQPCIKTQLRRAEANQFLEELERLLPRETTEEPDEADLVGKAKPVMRAPALAELQGS